MSLEEKLAANTAALEANTAALNAVAAAWNTLAGQAATIKAKADTGEVKHVAAAGTVVADLRPANVEGPKTPKATKAEKPAATPAAAVTDTPAPAEAAPAEAATASPSKVEHDGTPDSVTLEDVQAAVRLKLQEHKEELKAVLAKFGATKASNLDPSKWLDALKAINAIGSAEEDFE